ncbi:MAG: hypothetical protein H6Q70_482 [Firmicutes bacterium]|nr:hypothetical protein [Bacillota bacterium]
MEKYDGLNYGLGTHTIKVSLQDGIYKGAFTYEMGGNCKGFGVLDFDITEHGRKEVSSFQMIDCKIKRDNDDEDYLLVTLTNSAGDTCDYELEDDEFNSMIIGIEIIDFKVDKK